MSGVGRATSSLIAFVALTLPGCFNAFPEGLPRDGGASDVDPFDGGDGRVESDATPTDMRLGDADLPDGPVIDARPPPPERCNGLDDDGDGVIDEAFADIGMPCVEGQGVCRAEGEMGCADDEVSTTCRIEFVVDPIDELCNGSDDDCDGSTDETFPDVGEACIAGFGVCGVEALKRCTDDGLDTECDGLPALERAGPDGCNGLDDDCDDRVDENLVRGCRVPDVVGACRVGEETCVEGEWVGCAGPAPADESCNGLDDDCDGRVDNGFFLGEACVGNLPNLMCEDLRTIRQCAPDAAGTECRVEPEAGCDGEDENCDGVIDGDGVCGPTLANQCRFWIGWSTRAVPSPSPDWGGCTEGPGFGDDFSCNGTATAGRFATLSIPAGVDVDAADDLLGVALQCPAEDPALVYLGRHCRLYLGVARGAVAPDDGAEAWGPCPAEPVGGDDTIACTSNSEDGGFNPMPPPIDLDADAVLGVAFRCEDRADPARAEAAMASVEVFVAWAAAGADVLTDADLTAICQPPGDGDPRTACASTSGDGLFHTLRPTGDVGGGDTLAIMVRPR